MTTTEARDIVERLRDEWGWTRAAAAVEIERLRAENARLREALKPFADGWQRFRLIADGPVSDWYPHEVVDGVVWGDFLKAARALSQPQEGK